MAYNNIEDQLKTFAKFVFIYETKIKQMTKETDFNSISSDALHSFKRMQKSMKYAKEEEIRNTTIFSKQTLLFTKNKVQILDFCRHLRNSICHGIISKDDKKINIPDKYRGRVTAKGFLEYETLIEFVVKVMQGAEEKGMV